FFARFSSVSFGTTGLNSPYPRPDIRDDSILFSSTKYRTTDIARPAESSQLLGYLIEFIGTLSVKPSTIISLFEDFNNSARESNVSWPIVLICACPESNNIDS